MAKFRVWWGNRSATSPVPPSEHQAHGGGGAVTVGYYHYPKRAEKKRKQKPIPVTPNTIPTIAERARESLLGDEDIVAIYFTFWDD